MSVTVDAQGFKYELNPAEVECFGLIKRLVKDIPDHGEVPVPVKSEIFEILLEYVRSHLKSTKNWEDIFVAKYEPLLASIFEPAQFLDVAYLQDTLATYFANKIKQCQTTKDIAQTLGIKEEELFV